MLDLPYRWRSKHDNGDSVGSVRQRFHDHGEQLLILGGAGSGKSVLMLRLMAELAEEARQKKKKKDREIPFPVSIGVGEPVPDDFLRWVARRIVKETDLPEPKVVELLEYGRLVPCVENLELVPDADRQLWARRIAAHMKRPMATMVLTCRTDTYATLTTKPEFGLVVTLTGLAPEGPGRLSVVSKLGEDAGDDSVPDVEVLLYLVGEFGDLLTSEYSTLMDRARREYALLNRYVDDLTTSGPREEFGGKSTDEYDPERLRRGLRGVAEALEHHKLEFLDRLDLTVTTNQTRVRSQGARVDLPHIKQNLFMGLFVIAAMTAQETLTLGAHVLVILEWSVLQYWYVKVYGGLTHAPAMRWVGRWTHGWGRTVGVALKMVTAAYVVSFVYALVVRVPTNEAVVVAAIMGGAVGGAALVAGLVKFRGQVDRATVYRRPLRVLVRAIVVGLVAGPVLAGAAVWCEQLVETRGSAWDVTAVASVVFMTMIAGGYACTGYLFNRISLRFIYGVPWQLDQFLAAASARRLLVSVDGAYRFPHSTVRSAILASGAEEDVPDPAPKTEPWEDGRDKPHRLFSELVDEVLPTHRQAEALARADDLLTGVARFERNYRACATLAEQQEDELAPRFWVPMYVVFLLFATSPLWVFVFPQRVPLSWTDGMVSVGIAVAMFLVPVVLAARETTSGVSVPVGVVWFLFAIFFLSRATRSAFETWFGPAKLGDIQLFYEIMTMMFGPVLLAVVLYLICRPFDFRRRAVRWRPVHAAYLAWRTALSDAIRAVD